ncbi:MAG: DinB family protein [Bacteroidota bacterium]
MQQLFTITRQNRKLLYRYLTDTPVDLLYKIPQGFNNNMWWNIAHVVVTQQKLVYGLSGLPLNLSDTWVKAYEKGTFPKGTPTAEEIDEMQQLLFDLPERTEKDYENGIFQTFKPYTTSVKVTLNSLEDAMAFNVFHEGLHLGSLLALARAVKV